MDIMYKNNSANKNFFSNSKPEDTGPYQPVINTGGSKTNFFSSKNIAIGTGLALTAVATVLSLKYGPSITQTLGPHIAGLPYTVPYRLGQLKKGISKVGNFFRPIINNISTQTSGYHPIGDDYKWGFNIGENVVQSTTNDLS